MARWGSGTGKGDRVLILGHENWPGDEHAVFASDVLIIGDVPCLWNRLKHEARCPVLEHCGSNGLMAVIPGQLVGHP